MVTSCYISYILMIPLDISVYPPAVLRFSARLKAVVASSKATEQLNQVSRHASGIKWVDGTSSMGLLKPSDATCLASLVGLGGQRLILSIY